MTDGDKTKLQKKLSTIVLGEGTLKADGKSVAYTDLLPRLACLEGQWLVLMFENLDEVIYEMEFRTLPTAYIPEDEGYLPTVNFIFGEDCDVTIDTTWPQS